MNFKQFSATFAAGIAALSVAPLAGCGSGGGDNSGNTGGNGGGLTVSKSFYPLTDASGTPLSWTYDFVSSGNTNQVSTFKINYVGTATFGGQGVYKFTASGADGFSYLNLAASGIAYAGGQFGGIDSSAWTEDWYIRFDMSPGQSREFTSVVGNAAGTYRYRLSRLADQQLATAAGTFVCAVYQKTALVVTGAATSDYSVGDVDTYWFASGVGLVKDTYQYSDGATDTSTLRSFGAVPTGTTGGTLPTGGTVPVPAR